MVANHLFGRKAAQPLIRGADVGDEQLGICFPEHVQRVFRQQFVQVLAFAELPRTLLHLFIEGVVAFLQIGQWVNFALTGLPIRNGDAAVHDLPVFAFKPKNQHQARHFP